MTRETFKTWVADPLGVSESAVDELKAFTDSYPWCQTGHMLTSVVLHKQQAPDFNERLKRAAVYTVDREVLFNLMMRPALESTVKAFDASIETEIEQADTPKEQEKSEAEEEVLTSPDSESKTEFKTDAQQNEAAPDPELDAQERVTEERKSPPEIDDLQREIVVEAISSTIKKEVDEADEPDEDSAKELQSPHSEKDQSGDAEVSEMSQQEVSPSTSVEVAKPTEQDAEISPEHQETHSAYARWLLSRSRNRQASASPNEVPVATKEEDQEDDSKEVDQKTKQLAIIDRFIQSDPKITPGKAELFSTENLAKMSLVEDEEFVTETMAMIYARQGNKKKALKAYKLLSLKYPEKSIYFANQIKKLREDGDRPKKQ